MNGYYEFCKAALSGSTSDGEYHGGSISFPDATAQSAGIDGYFIGIVAVGTAKSNFNLRNGFTFSSYSHGIAAVAPDGVAGSVELGGIIVAACSKTYGYAIHGKRGNVLGIGIALCSEVDSNFAAACRTCLGLGNHHIDGLFGHIGGGGEGHMIGLCVLGVGIGLETYGKLSRTGAACRSDRCIGAGSGPGYISGYLDSCGCCRSADRNGGILNSEQVGYRIRRFSVERVDVCLLGYGLGSAAFIFVNLSADYDFVADGNLGVAFDPRLVAEGIYAVAGELAAGSGAIVGNIEGGSAVIGAESIFD